MGARLYDKKWGKEKIVARGKSESVDLVVLDVIPIF